MARPFEGRVVLVTGVSSGIGRTPAFAFAKQGAAVVVSARRVPEGEETAIAIHHRPCAPRRCGPGCSIVECVPGWCPSIWPKLRLTSR